MTATVMLTLDFELAWGQLDRPLDSVLPAARYAHDHGVHAILDLLKQYNIPATWSCVGAMIGGGVDRDEELDEAISVRFPSPWGCNVPPRGSELTNPEFFGPSLFEAIRRSTPDHEIAFHGYTHLSFGDPAMTRRRAHQELRACRRLATRLGVDATSFVFPRNQVGHLDALLQHGFDCYRAPDLRRHAGGGLHVCLLEELLADWACLAPLAVRPSVQGPLVAIPGSAMLTFAVGKRRWIPDSARYLRLRRGLERARVEDGILHIWLHPINLWPESERSLAVLSAFLEAVAAAVARGDAVVRTMREVARAALRNQSAMPVEFAA